MNQHYKKKRKEARDLFESKESWDLNSANEAAKSLTPLAARFFVRMLPNQLKYSLESFLISKKTLWSRRRKESALDKVKIAQHLPLHELEVLLLNLPNFERRALFNLQDKNTRRALEPTMKHVREYNNYLESLKRKKRV